MAKLSAPQDKAIHALTNGEFPLGTNKRTIDALVNNGYVTEDNTFYDLTEKGREYMGLPSVANTTVDEIVELLEPVADWERELTALLISAVPSRWADPRYLAENVKVWQGLTLSEIKKDIRTAVPVGREGMRQLRKHAKHNH